MMLSEGAICRAAAEEGSYLEPKDHCCNAIFSKQHEKNDSECNSDDISCISGADGPLLMVGNNGILLGDMDAVNVETASCCLAGNQCVVKEECNCSNEPNKFTGESLQESAPLSDRSDLSEISSFRNIYAVDSLVEGDHSEHFRDQVQSSSKGLIAINIQGGKPDALDRAKTVKFKFGEDLATNSVNCLGLNEDIHLHEMPNVQEPVVPSQSVSCNEGSELMEDVKVCDICGDAGREALLAICSKCSDGAEHIYCMRVRVDTVPEGDWTCEECALLEETEKQKLSKIKATVEYSKGPSSSRICQISKTSCSADGTFTKSNSFKISDSRLQARPCGGGSHKQTIARQSPTGAKEKDGTLGMISESLSFNDVNSGRSSTTDSQFRTSFLNLSHAEALGRLRDEKECNSIQRKFTSKLNKPLVSLPVTGVSTFKNVKRMASHGQPILRQYSTIQCIDLKAVKHSIEANTSHNPACQLAHDGSDYTNDLSGAGTAKRLRSCLSDVVQGPTSPMMHDSSHEQRTKVELRCSSLIYRKNYGGSCEIAQEISQDILPSQESFNQDEKTQEISNASTSGKSISPGNKSVLCYNRPNVDHAAESCIGISPQTLDPDAGIPKGVGESNCVDLVPKFWKPSDVYGILAVPRLDYIWKGGFQVQCGQRLPRFCCGIQAHLSTQASPKVSEVVKKFPCRLVLEEIPRLSLWPTQFVGIPPKEDNIGLYFFAEDLESYANYKSLLECMINYDFALKGNFDGIELLIFSSNLLPKRCQRWNTLFFLWGVFKGRVDGVNCMPSFQKKTPIPTLKVISDQDLSASAVSGFQSVQSSMVSSECIPATDLHDNVKQSSKIDLSKFPTASSARRNDNHESKPSSPGQKYFAVDWKLSGDDTISRSSVPMTNEQALRDMQNISTSLNNDGVPTRKQEDCLRHPQGSSTRVVDCVLQRDEAFKVKIKKNSRTAAKSQFASGPGPCAAVGKVGFKSSQWQVHSSDCKDQMESESLDLDLSLGVGKKCGKGGLAPVFPGSVDKNNEEKKPNLVATNTNNDGCANLNDFSASLDLSLALSSFGE